MNLVLSWNLVLMTMFIVIFSYNFLLGQNSTIKLILAIYVAILTADGIATLFQKFFFDISPGFQQLFKNHEVEMFTILRIGLFLLAVIIFVVKGGVHIKLEKHDHMAIRTLIHGVFAFFSSALFLATLLIYVSGNSFIEGMMQASKISFYNESFLARNLIDYYQAWFSFPAIIFLITSFFFEQKD